MSRIVLNNNNFTQNKFRSDKTNAIIKKKYLLLFCFALHNKINIKPTLIVRLYLKKLIW